MTCTILTNEQIQAHYEEAYRAFFGKEPPPVRQTGNGGFRVRFAEGGKSYTKRELRAITGMMLDLKDMVNAHG
jgi:hypothetical protein